MIRRFYFGVFFLLNYLIHKSPLISILGICDLKFIAMFMDQYNNLI